MIISKIVATTEVTTIEVAMKRNISNIIKMLVRRKQPTTRKVVVTEKTEVVGEEAVAEEAPEAAEEATKVDHQQAMK